jgi:hypothetical protein
MPIATLSIDLEARLAKLQEGLDKAGHLTAKFANDVDARMSGLQTGTAAFASALAGAFSARVITDWVKGTVDGLDALNDLKDATGSSIENISALEDVAARTGTSFESMAGTLIKFNKVLGEAKDNNDTERTLKNLGLSAEELRKLDPAEALRQTAVALDGFADSGTKARAIQELFGKSVAEAAPFLNDLAEKTALVGTTTEAQTKAAEAFNKQLDNLAKNSKDAARSLISDFIPALNKMFEATGNGQGSLLDGLLGTSLSAKTQREATLISEAIARTTDSIERMQEALNRKGGAGADSQLEASISKARQRLVGLQTEAAAATAKLKDLANIMDGGVAGGGGNPTKPDLKETPDKVKAVASEFDKYIEKLKEAQLATLALTEEEKARVETTFGKLAAYSPAQKAYAIEAAKTVDVLKEMAKAEKQLVGPTIPEDLLKRRVELEKEFQSVINSTPTAKLQKQRDLQVELVNAYEQGRFGIVGSAEATRAYIEAVQTALPELEKLKDETNEFAKQAAANIESSLGETVKRTLKGDFDSILDLWIDMLLDMAAQAAAANLAKSLFGADFGKTGNVGGLIGSFFSGGGGTGSSTGAQLDLNDTGGYFGSAGGIESIASAGGGGRMSVTIVQNNQIGSDLNRGEVAQAITSANNQTKADIGRLLKQRGLG